MQCAIATGALLFLVIQLPTLLVVAMHIHARRDALNGLELKARGEKMSDHDREEVRNDRELIYGTVREQINFRRSREQQIFVWSSAILLGLISRLLLFQVGEEAMIRSCSGKIYLTLVTIVVAVVSCSWQQKQRTLLCRAQRLLVKIQENLGFFELKTNNNELLLPEYWKSYGMRNESFLDRLKVPSKISATAGLLFASVLAIWLF